jgi:hypothetical protein
VRNVITLLRNSCPTSINLLKWPEKFQSEQTDIAQIVLPEHLGSDGRSFAWNHAGRGRRRGRDGKMYDLVRPKNMCARNTRARGADVQRFCELNEVDTRRVRTANENRHLKPDPLRAAALCILQALSFLDGLSFQD